MGWPSAVGLAALVALHGARVTAQSEANRDDLLAVVSAALYPIEIMAYCHRAVAADPQFRDVGEAWNTRNGGLLATLQDKAAAAGVSDAARRAADARALADIEAAVAGAADQAAYCRLIARLIDGGYYDIDQRADLKPALKRIFGKP
jgi:uncharacterized protein YdbL (DUF1318 family)